MILGIHGLLFVDLFVSALISWIIVSVAVFLAARIVVGKRVSFVSALGLVLIGVVSVHFFSIFTTTLFGSFLGSILTFLVWLWLI
ncbi:hypothetical protein DRO26_02140, partial [Candidatus Bathyarchaeota archaeon]